MVDGDKTIRAALLCTASDIPATRKVGGFVGHGSLKGCSRCLKPFPTTEFGTKPDYSGFQRSMWPKRSLQDHQTQGMNWKHANTLKKRQDIEHDYGVHFTELLRLPYFDSIRFAVVDPMHNVLLRSAKHIMMLWKGNGMIVSDHFASIQDTVDKFVTPADIGRIPHKISSGFSSFTADQWKNWTLIYSQVVLKEILSDEHYQCWHTFVMACHFMCSRAISQAAVSQMDAYLMSFCKSVERLFGPDACTPNLHLHGHPQECYMDYGTADSFWLFAFERMNGILGSVSTNHQAIEIQLMRKFLSTQQVYHTLNSGAMDEDLKGMLKSARVVKGSLKRDQLSELPLLDPLSQSTVENFSALCKLLPPIRESCLTYDEVSDINSTMRICFGESYSKTLLLHDYSRASFFQNELYGCVDSHHANSSLVYVGTGHRSGGANRPGFVRKYVKVTVLLNPPPAPPSQSTQLLPSEIESSNIHPRRVTVHLAAVNWLDVHP